MLCDKCQQREATNHVFNFSNTAGDVPTTNNLCNECSEPSSPRDREMASAWQTGCSYCGGQPFSSHGGQKFTVLCRRCSQEYYRFIKHRLPRLGEGDLTREQIANLSVVLSEVHVHMKRWVLERGAD